LLERELDTTAKRRSMARSRPTFKTMAWVDHEKGPW